MLERMVEIGFVIGCVCAIASHTQVPDSVEPFAATLDSFLGLVFVPTFRNVLKLRSLTVPLAS